MSLLLHIIVTYIKKNIIIKLQKLYSPPRNPRAGNKSPVLFVEKPLCTGDLLPTCKYSLKGLNNLIKPPFPRFLKTKPKSLYSSVEIITPLYYSMKFQILLSAECTCNPHLDLFCTSYVEIIYMTTRYTKKKAVLWMITITA